MKFNKKDYVQYHTLRKTPNELYLMEAPKELLVMLIKKMEAQLIKHLEEV